MKATYLVSSQECISPELCSFTMVVIGIKGTLIQARLEDCVNKALKIP